MKVIFLDIDGVLNSLSTKETFEGYVFVSDKHIILLKELIDRTGAKVVLTSSWRWGWFCSEHPYVANESDEQDIRLFKALRDKLKAFGIELFSFTADFGFRGEEIDWWLKNQGEEVESFVILDDMDGREMHPHSRFLVQTSMKSGLQKNHIVRAEKILMCNQLVHPSKV